MKRRFSKSYQPPSSPLDQEVQREVAEILQKEGRSYIKLVETGLRVVVDQPPDSPKLTLKQYRKLLQDEGLPGPRASEIKTILASPAIAREFVAAKGMTVNQALAKARGKAPATADDAECGIVTKVDPIIAALTRLIAIKGTEVGWDIDLEEYVISYRPTAASDSGEAPK